MKSGSIAPRIRATSTLPEFFRRRLHDSARRFDPQPHEDTFHYLGGLLERFSQSDQLFEYHEQRIDLRPLALLYGDAQAARSERERCLLLQRLGDLALFLGALFPERFARRGIRRDYFVGMGGGAYDYLAERAPHSRHVFRELTSRFTQMTGLVASACYREAGLDAEAILRLYSRWRQTGNEHLASQLRSLGIHLPEGGDGHHA